MTTEILTPILPESVADATVATWHKQAGDRVTRDDVLVEIETDKVVLEVPAPVDGVLVEITQATGATVVSSQLLGKIDTAQAGDFIQNVANNGVEPTPADRQKSAIENDHSDADSQGPAIRRLLVEHGIEANQVQGTGVGGRLTREDINAYLAKREAQQAKVNIATEQNTVSTVAYSARSEKRVPMTRLRKRIAERLLEAKNSTAMLTTFNEVDMQPIMNLRKQYGDKFEKQHGVRLGFMSFYIKAVVEALS